MFKKKVVKIRRMFNSVTLSKAAIAMMATRLWQNCSAILTAYLFTKYVSLDLQGIYYTITSLLAIVYISEMGASFAVTQICSHESVNFKWLEDGTILGSNESKQRIKSILKFVGYWYGGLGFMVGLVVLIFGGKFLVKNSNAVAGISNILIPWSIAVIASAILLFQSGLFAILEGCGKMYSVQRFRLYQSVLSSVAGWILLIEGFDIYFVAGVYSVQVVSSSVWLLIAHRVFFVSILNVPNINNWHHWKSELFTFQSRMALSWIAGYFLFQMFNPILLATQGPQAAGRMGMSLQMFSGIAGIAQAWVVAKAPFFGQLVATNQRRMLDQNFFRCLIQSSAFLIIIIIMFFILLSIIVYPNNRLAERILGPIQMVGLSIATISNHIISSGAVYLRAHKCEPLMWHSIMMAVVLNVLMLFFAPVYGLNGVISVYAGTTVFLGLSAGIFIFLRERRRHCQASRANIVN